MLRGREDEFRAALLRRLERAEKNGETYRDLRAGDLHREVGGRFDADHHRMPTFCEATDEGWHEKTILTA